MNEPSAPPPGDAPEDSPVEDAWAPPASPGRLLAKLIVGYLLLLATLVLAKLGFLRWPVEVTLAVTLLVPLALMTGRGTLLGDGPRAGLLSLAEGLAAAAVFIPLFFLVVAWVWRFKEGDVGAGGFARRAVFEVAVVALPEELFFRAFLQEGLEKLARRKARVLGARLGWGWLAATALFALVHLPQRLHPAALLVFLPGLVFGWLWARRKSLAGPVIFHALCNLSLIWVQPGVF
jgi:membrane protease YdiL (CAAX protease family)